MLIGIDVGISTTKIVGIMDGEVVSPIRITAVDPVTSLYGAFGKYLHDNDFRLEDIDHVILTGVGSEYISQPIYGLPTSKCDEFVADGLGARYESGIDKAIVVSMGTGTSFVKCEGCNMEHIGGIGTGGGTLQGLSRLLLNTNDIKFVSEIATRGNLGNINLLIGDISAKPLPGLPMDATASLFGKAQSNTSQEDIAKGLVCLVLQSIGSAAILAGQGTGINEYILIGNLTLLLQNTTVKAAEINAYLDSIGSTPVKGSVHLADILTRPGVTTEGLRQFCPEMTENAEVVEAAEILIKYNGYIRREKEYADKMHRLEDIKIGGHFDYNSIQSLSTEARQKLTARQPETLAQASRIPGVSPSDINVLLVMLGR